MGTGSRGEVDFVGFCALWKDLGFPAASSDTLSQIFGRIEQGKGSIGFGNFMDHLGSILEIVAELGESSRDDGKPEEHHENKPHSGAHRKGAQYRQQRQTLSRHCRQNSSNSLG